MSILIDYSQISIAAIIQSFEPSRPLNEGMIRHMILSSILHYKTKYMEAYGDVIICVDSKNYWRKDHFPEYKGKRKAQRDNSPFDWVLIHTMKDKIISELREHFPYRVIQVERAEADDIIGAIIEYAQAEVEETIFGFTEPEKMLIVSGDSDYIQLQKYRNVRQWSPTKKMFFESSNPERDLIEKIIRGDERDGIPNIRSDNDAYMNPEKRCKPILTTKVNIWVNQKPEEFCDPEMLKNYNRNARLIDLSFTPKEIKDEAIRQYKQEAPKKRDFMNYFMKNQLRNLSEQISYF